MDPETGARYEYSATGGSNYRLCANFAADGSQSVPHGSVFWAHRAGRACFMLDASKQAPL